MGKGQRPLARHFYFSAMVRSMTGFGRAEGMVGDRKVSVELRSVNSKQLDLFLKLPGRLREWEPDLRRRIADRVVRGKAEVVIVMEAGDVPRQGLYEKELVRRYYEQIKALADEVAPGHDTDLLGLVLRSPEVLRGGEDPLSDAEWDGVIDLVDQACAAFARFRMAEGAEQERDLAASVDRVITHMKAIEMLDQGRVERVRERLRAKVEEIQVNVDRDRFEQELVYYLEKFDINEEKVRLGTHCVHFMDTLAADEPQGQGRKLGFIAQEMGREMNTIGSKANDADIQKLVVAMKDDLEKIKEQLLNVL